MKDIAATIMERCEHLGEISEEPGEAAIEVTGRFLELVAGSEREKGS